MDLTKKHRVYFNVAKEVAKLSDFERTHVGCSIVYQHRVISSASNSTKTHPKQKKLNRCRFETDSTQHMLHAEVAALLPLIGRKDIDFSRVSVYVYRQYKSGELAPARCCPSCMALIRSLGIRHLYYTMDGSYVHEELIY